MNSGESNPARSLASLDLSRQKIDRPDNNPNALVFLALSGGGSRAAYLSAGIMFKLQEVFKDQGIDLLREVDLISSVSGGSLPAAYYLISADTGDEKNVKSKRVWEEETVKKLMSRNYIRRWFGNWFWPTNIARFWFTDYDRSDIMAQTLADNLFDVAIGGNLVGGGQDLVFADANRKRPNVVLNATASTATNFGDVFQFTDEKFSTLNSDIQQYEVSRAVMASATFPAVFNYMTLGKFPKGFQSGEKIDSYMHVFDGGNSDNLGLTTVIDAIEKNDNGDQKIIVILVDAYTGTKGISDEKSDGRRSVSYLVDLNFLDALDALLSENRRQKVIETRRFLNEGNRRSRSTFWHITFDTIDENTEDGNRLKNGLRNISTNFKISKKDTKLLDEAVNYFVSPDNACLKFVKEMLSNGDLVVSERQADPCWTESLGADL